MADSPYESDADGLGRDPAAVACLDRARSLVLNILVGDGMAIAASGLILRRHDPAGGLPWGLVAERRAATIGVIVLVALGYLVLRVGSSRPNLADPATRARRFVRARVGAALIGAAAIPLGFAHGWFAEPRLEALAPAWVAALGLGFLALPRGHELDGFGGPIGAP